MRPAAWVRVFITTICLVAGVTGPWSQPAFSDPVTDPAVDEPAGGGEAILFEDIPSVQTASKYEQTVTEAPATISVVTADEIRKYGYRTLADILASQSGLFTTYDRGYHRPTVRGFGVPGDYNSRLLLLIDGHRINDGFYGAAPIGTEFPLDVDLIERVEVMRGPGSSLYGTSAFLGVVNVITRRGRDLDGGELGAGYGSMTTYDGILTYGKRLENGLELVGSGSLYGSDGMRRVRVRAFDDPELGPGVSHNADDDGASRVFGKLAWQDFALHAGWSRREKGLPNAPYETIFDTSANRSWDEWGWADLSWSRPVAGWDVKARAYYDSFQEDGDYLYDYSEDGGPARVMNQDDLRADRWGIDLGVQRTVFEKHHLAIGAELIDAYRIDIRNGDSFPRETYLDESPSALDWGLYLQDEWSITDELVLLVGLRHDQTEFGGGSTTPRAALVWTPRSDTALKVLYGEAFRAPSAYELFYTDGGLTQKAPDGLAPETVRTLEAVAEHQFDENWRIGASLYGSDFEDLIALVNDPIDDLLVYQNFSSARSYGVELRLEAHWASGFEGALSYALQRTEDGESGDRLINSPRQIARLNALAPLWRERVFFAFELQYSDDRLTWDGRGTDDFFLANLALLYRPQGLPIEVSAGVKNLLDERYADPVSEEYPEAAVEQNGRTFFVRAWLRF